MSMPVQAAGTSFSDVSNALGLDEEGEPCTTSGWFDMDGDGREEAIWVSQEGIRYAQVDDEGKLTVKLAVISGDSFFQASHLVQPILGAGDFDKDGERDLMVVNERVNFYRRVGPATFEELHLPTPPLPVAAFVSDAAVGDLNMDGWPDILLSTARRQAGHLYSPGAVDLVLMNRFGVFVMEELKPARAGEGHGLTIADMNKDGLVDVVESVDFGPVVGGSRLLLNETSPGAASAFFGKVQVYDPHGYGMGASVGDLDGDGNLDIYNTSTARDFLLYRNDEGELTDRTLELGITHHMGNESVRIQWSPSFADFNGDGLLDIYVHHDNLFIFGGPANNIIDTELLTLKPQSCLLYEQQMDGSFIRRNVPFDPLDFSGGTDATVGDANQDGRLDIGQGTVRQVDYITIKTRAYLWLNETPKEPGSHAIVLSLKGTVGIDPPVGATVTATCSNTTQTRTLTSGGKMGGLSGSYVHFGWPQCEGDIQATVQWPSGVSSTHVIGSGSNHALLTEPTWLEVKQENETWSVHLDPTLLTEQKLCVHDVDLDTWECCETNCEKPTNPLEPTYDRVRGGEEGPQFALPLGPAAYVLRTDPILPVPGETFTIKVTRTHPLTGVAEETNPWLRIDGAKVPWTTETEDGFYEASAQGAPGGEELSLTLFQDAKIALKQSIPSGFSLDPRTAEYFLYPTQDPSGSGSWRMLFTPSMPLESVDKKAFTAQLSDGTPINTQIVPAGTGRLAVDIDWSGMKPGTGIVLFDQGIKRSEILPAVTIANTSDLVEEIAGVHAYFSRHELIEDGDSAVLYLTLLDEKGRPLPPDPDAVVLETDDFIVVNKPGRMNEAIRNWDLRAVVRTKPGLEPATVKVLRSDGLLLGEFSVERRPSLELPFSASETTISLSHESIPAGVGASATLHIYARNQWRELLGLDTKTRVETTGPFRILSPAVVSDGHVAVTIEAGYFGGQWPIDVYLNDTYFDSITLAVVGPALPQDTPTVTWPDTADVDATDLHDNADTHTDTHTPTEGCTASQANTRPNPYWFVLVIMFLMVKRRKPRKQRLR